jgi:4'-phosphopantetheinyl transferase EntD
VIDELLPASVVAVETRGDRPGVALFPEEEAVVERAVEKRRREYATVRWCARTAFERLGLPPQAVPTGPHGEPRWPDGVVGSMTHCDGYRACALARPADVVALGIDAEPNLPLPGGLLPDIARPEEIPRLRALERRVPGVHWDRLLFSAKESVYKAWFPLAGRWLGFEDATLTVDVEAGAFAARLLVPGPRRDGREVTGFSGRWLVRDGLVLTAIAQSGGELR